jgi:hypothetical protein
MTRIKILGQIEDQKLDAKARQQENLATKKIEAVRNETTNMLQHLTAQQKKMQLSTLQMFFC